MQLNNFTGGDLSTEAKMISSASNRAGNGLPFVGFLISNKIALCFIFIRTTEGIDDTVLLYADLK